MAFNKVFKNTFVLGIAQFINKLLLFILTIFIARYLKDSGFGQYSLVITVVGFFTLLTNFGFGTILFREVSKDYSKAAKYFTNVLFLRICIGIPSFLLLFFVIKILKYQPVIVLASCIYGLTLFTNNIIDAFTSIFNAFEKMEYMAYLMVFLNLLTLIFGILALKYGYGLVALVSVSAAAGILTVILGFFFAAGSVSVNISDIDITFCRELIKNSFPLMMLSFLGVIYFRIDILMLSKMKTDTDVGLYNAAYKLMDTFMIVSNSIIGAVFPYLSRYFHLSLEKLKSVVKKLFILLLLLGLVFASVVFIFSKQLIVLFFGPSFVNSADALKILAWAVPVIYVNALLLYTLIAANKQFYIMFLTAAALVFNFTANLILIPKYNYIASSYVTVASEIMVFTGFFYLVRRTVFSKI